MWHAACPLYFDSVMFSQNVCVGMFAEVVLVGSLQICGGCGPDHHVFRMQPLQ